MYPPLSYEKLLEHVLVALAKACNVERVSEHARLGSLALNSVEIAGFMQDLALSLDRVLAPSLFWQFPTAAALAGHLSGKISRLQLPSGAARDIVEPLAVVGLACCFPGASNAQQYWHCLRNSEVLIGEEPSQRFTEQLSSQWRISPRERAGYLEDVSSFDHALFGITACEARNMDPQQRILLEIAWQALEDADLDPEDLKGKRGGVFIGAMWSDFAHHIQPAQMTSLSATGLDPSLLSARLSYTLGLSGPSLTVNTACSSSLVALHLAAQAIQLNDCDFAVVGGINLLLAAHSFTAMRRFGGLSASGACRPFDAAADGYVRAEGCGVVILKPLAAALANADLIYGIVRATAINNNGHHSSLTAPSLQAQQQLLRTACARAGVSPAEIHYVEAHGTGTTMGDPIEAAAIASVYGQAHNRVQPVLIGSVKGNIGHCEAAAGVAGLIKLLLSMHYHQIPAQANYQSVNPHIDLRELGLAIPTQTGDWPNQSGLLMAGLSAFGFGGTNVHAIISDHWPTVSVENYRGTVSPRDGTVYSVVQQKECLASTDKMASTLTPDRVVDAVTPGETLLIFPGQGAHWRGMGRSYARLHPVFKEIIKRCDQWVQKLAGWSLAARIYDDEEIFSDVQIAWPCHLAMQLGISAIWQAKGVLPTAVIGHSIGEVAAAQVAGLITVEAAFKIILAQAAWAAAHTGAMAVVGLDWQATAQLLATIAGSCSCAIQHQDDATVISGPSDQIQLVQQHCVSSQVKFSLVKTTIAVHTPAVAADRSRLAALIPSVHCASPRMAFYSGMGNLGINNHGQQPLTQNYWCDLVINPIRWFKTITEVISSKVAAVVEVSPHSIIASTVSKAAHIAGIEPLITATDRHDFANIAAMEKKLALLVKSQAVNQLRNSQGNEQLLVLSGHSIKLLKDRAAVIADWLLEEELELAQASQALANYASHYRYRLACIATERRVAAERLREMILQCKGDGASYDSKKIGHSAWVVVEYPPMVDGEIKWLLGEYPSFFAEYSRVSNYFASHNLPLEHPLVLAARQQIAFTALLAEHNVHIAKFDRHYSVGAGWIIADYLNGWCSLMSLTEQLGRKVRAGGALSRDGDGALFRLGARARVEKVAFLCLLSLNSVIEVDALTDPGTLSRASQGMTHRGALLMLLRHLYLSGAISRIGGFCPTISGQKVVVPGVRIRGNSGRPAGNFTEKITKDLETESLADKGQRWIQSYCLEWHEKKDPIYHELVPPQPVMIFASASHCIQLQSAFANAIWVKTADQPDITGKPFAAIRPAVTKDFIELLAYYQPKVIVYLWGLHWPHQLADTFADHMRYVCAPLNIIQGLPSVPATKLALYFVTAGCQPVGGEAVVGSRQALLWGLARTLRLELGHILCSVLDIDALKDDGLLLDSAIQAIQQAVGSGIAESAWRRGSMFTPQLLEEHRVTAIETAGGSTNHDLIQGFYLISGGLGALGLELAEMLLQVGVCRMLLIGRSPPSKNALQVLTLLRMRGAQIATDVADVADGMALRCVINRAAAELGPLEGIIHAAGILEPTCLSEVDPSCVQRVLSAKVDGAINLHSTSLHWPVKVFILISSVSSVMGFPRFSSYAAANAFLDSFAWERKSQGLPAVSIGFGPFAEKGMLHREHHFLEDCLLPKISMGQAVELFKQYWPPSILHPHRLIMCYQPDHHFATAKQTCLPEMKEFFHAFAHGNSTINRTVIQRVVVDIIANLMQIDGTAVSLEMPLSELGVTSLLGVEIRNRLQSRLSLRLPVILLWNYPTVSTIVNFLMEQLCAKRSSVSFSTSLGSGSRDQPISPSDELERSEEALGTQLLEELALVAGKFNKGAY